MPQLPAQEVEARLATLPGGSAVGCVDEDELHSQRAILYVSDTTNGSK